MNSNPNGNVTTVVIEMERGWIFVKISGPKPEPDRIEFFLRRTIEDWFNDHPIYVIDKTEAITNHGEIQGIHVWYHESVHLQQKTPREDTAPMDSFSIEVHGQIAQKHSREYIEAVVDDALKILPSFKNRQDTLVAINPRRVVVLLHDKSRKGIVLPLDFVQEVIDGVTNENLEKWLSNPPAPFYVTHIAGNWFGNRNEET